MKELLLQAVLYGGHRNTTPSDLCQWLISLTGGIAAEVPTDAPTDAPMLCHTPRSDAPMPCHTPRPDAPMLCHTSRPDAPMLYHTPRPGVLEVWLKDPLPPPPGGTLCYRRLSFRPLPPVRNAPPVASTGPSHACQIVIERLPAKRVYPHSPMSKMRLLGTSPTLVVVDGRVISYDSLTPAQVKCLNRMYAVLTPALSARLKLPAEVEGESAASSGPYAALQQEVEQLLARCFPTGGTVQGCPLQVSLRLADVPDERLRYASAEHRLLQFGAPGEGRDARTGFCLHGACLPAKSSMLSVTMFYPRGETDAACRLFELFAPLADLIAVVPLTNIDQWVPYDVDECAIRQLTQGLFAHPVEKGRLYCLVTPPGRAAEVLLQQHALVCLRGQIRFLGAYFLGPVPLHAVCPEVFDRYLPSLALHLLVQMGGLPWVPRCFASQDTDLVVGFSHSWPSQSLISFCAAAFFNDPLKGCRFDFVHFADKFLDFFIMEFQRAYEEFLSTHQERPPERLVIYCHHDLPIDLLQGFVRWMAPHSEAVPVVLVRLRRTSAATLRHYAPDAPGCMPPAGTFLYCGDDGFLLFCRDSFPSSGSRGRVYPYPLEVSLKRLAADGSLQSPLAEEVDGLLVQACQLVWANPEGLDGSPLPFILSHTDRLVRHRCQEWRARRSD